MFYIFFILNEIWCSHLFFDLPREVLTWREANSITRHLPTKFFIVFQCFSDYRSPVAPRFVTCICHGNGLLGIQTRGAFACLERQRVCDWKQSWTSGRCLGCEVRNQMSSEWIRYWNSTQHCGTLSSCRTGSIANVCNWTLPAFRRFDWKIKKQFKICLTSSYHFVSWHVLFRTHEASDESLAALSNELLDTRVWDWQIVKGACSGVGQCPVHFATLASLDLEITMIDNDCIIYIIYT